MELAEPEEWADPREQQGSLASRKPSPSPELCQTGGIHSLSGFYLAASPGLGQKVGILSIRLLFFFSEEF